MASFTSLDCCGRLSFTAAQRSAGTTPGSTVTRSNMELNICSISLPSGVELSFATQRAPQPKEIDGMSHVQSGSVITGLVITRLVVMFNPPHSMSMDVRTTRSG